MEDVNKNLESFFEIESSNQKIETTKTAGTTSSATQDYEFARNNLRSLISNGSLGLEGIMKVALESDSPRAYEVLANTIKTLAEINVNLMDVSAKFAETNKVNVKNTTNNSIFVGTTKDLQKLLKKENNFVEGELNEQPAKRLSSQPES
jgi:hypothetical protein